MSKEFITRDINTPGFRFLASGGRFLAARMSTSFGGFLRDTRRTVVLFVGLDMTSLSTIGTLSSCTGSLLNGWSRSRRRRCCSVHEWLSTFFVLLLLTSKTSFLIP